MSTNILDNLLQWIKKIDNHEKTIDFYIDEEGIKNIITLKNKNVDCDDICEMTISNDEYKFKKTISIKIFLIKLLNALFVLADRRTWGKNNSIGEYIKEKLKYYFEKYRINEYKECIECREKLCE
jgi:hypothetical protein